MKLRRLSYATLMAMSLMGGVAHPAKKQPQEHTCYIWGNGYYQARPGASGISFNNFTPKLIGELTQLGMAQLSLGQHFEAGVTLAGEVYVWDTHRMCSDPNVDDPRRKNLIKLPLPDKAGVKSVRFTKGFLWILTNKGDVYQYPIEHEEKGTSLKTTHRKIQTLQKITQIETGEDHFVALNDQGAVFSMGDDTYGQCGQGSNKRSTAPPFYDQRIRNPTQVMRLPPISKIKSGGNHTIAIGREGGVFGWGSNSKMQLSQQQEFSKVDEPLIAVFSPIRISSQMDTRNKVLDVALGEESSIFVTENLENGETEVFGCGHNLRGEVGVGYIRHITDIMKVEGLSNYKIKTANGEEHVRIKQIECGRNHCMALTSIGAILEWGDNEYGQMGNKKRSVTENPIIVNAFSKDNVFSIACGYLQSGVIIAKDKQN